MTDALQHKNWALQHKNWALEYHTLIFFLKGTMKKSLYFLIFLPGYLKAQKKIGFMVHRIGRVWVQNRVSDGSLKGPLGFFWLVARRVA